ncbi:MAG: ATP-binding cassette domain-containing protein [Saprospiraceae bacterium]|nr:ATP-binding cassette domain-containing protein [Saprospiraceae bacterium]
MIELENLSVLYSSHLVIDNLSHTFSKGKVYGIVGLNGAGKTTLFNVLAGIKKPAGGSLKYNGHQMGRSFVNFLETINYFYPYLTGREYLDIFLSSNKNYQEGSLQQAFSLPLDDLIETYSTGMKKKLALMAMLKKDKDIYLLDEPFNGLDLESNKMLEVVIDVLHKKEKTIFISSHIIDPLLRVCDEICLLENGKFSKVYGRHEFEQLEADLFGTFTDRTRNLLEGAI